MKRPALALCSCIINEVYSNFKAPFFRAATDTNRVLFGSGAPDLAQANLQEFQRRQKFTYT